MQKSEPTTLTRIRKSTHVRLKKLSQHCKSTSVQFLETLIDKLYESEQVTLQYIKEKTK